MSSLTMGEIRQALHHAVAAREAIMLVRHHLGAHVPAVQACVVVDELIAVLQAQGRAVDGLRSIGPYIIRGAP